MAVFDRRTQLIDRHLIRDALEKLRICTIEIQANSGYRSYDEHYQSIRAALDQNSSTELKFLEHLYQNGLRLPDGGPRRGG